MENTSSNKKNKHICIGLLAHVDAGKTTLSEAILYTSGAIRKLGRVDHKTAFLDNNTIEKNRGITVFSKEAGFSCGDKEFTLLDTPGHVDFSAEAERTLGVLDYAVLIISGADGVQGHTVTLWRLLEAYGVPAFIFVNKMDQAGTDKQRIMDELNSRLGGGFAEFWDGKAASGEEAAVCDEGLMEEFLETEKLSDTGKKDFGMQFLNELEQQYTNAVLQAKQENENLQRRADMMRKQMDGNSTTPAAENKNTEDFLKQYVHENSVRVVDPLDLKNRLEEMKKQQKKLLKELDMKIKVSNALTYVEV